MEDEMIRQKKVYIKWKLDDPELQFDMSNDEVNAKYHELTETIHDPNGNACLKCDVLVKKVCDVCSLSVSVIPWQDSNRCLQCSCSLCHTCLDKCNGLCSDCSQ